MVIILKSGTSQETRREFIQSMQARGLSVQVNEGSHSIVLGILGDTSALDLATLRANDAVEDVKRISEHKDPITSQYEH